MHGATNPLLATEDKECGGSEVNDGGSGVYRGIGRGNDSCLGGGGDAVVE